MLERYLHTYPYFRMADQAEVESQKENNADARLVDPWPKITCIAMAACDL